jgi:hypothetical protein
MKKLTTLLLLSLLSFNCISQQTNLSPSVTKQDYLKKSKKQKTIAFVLAGGGSIAWLAGLGKYMNQEDNIDGGGEAAMIIGGTVALVSIPFFIISSKNKKKAMRMSFKNQVIPQLQNSGFVHRTIPSINLKIDL